jgi:hypothetical protein
MRRQRTNTAETLAALAHRASFESYSVFSELIEEFQVVTLRPVVFIVDEHNEIYKLQKENTPFFRHFTIATGYLTGVRGNSFLNFRFELGY